jgi:hypothetical protein
VIDPRGLDAAERPTLFGDPRYDIAKLHHSVVGRYDEIIAGRFSLSRAGPLDMTLALEPEAGRETIQAIFLATAFAGVTPDEAQAGPIAILLFLSMLPLHADNPVRQGALLANALRLFLAMDW